MKTKIYIFSLFISIIYSQGISELKLIDGYSLPLAYDDNGIRLQYSTTSSGNLSGYLKSNYNDFRLFSDKKEFKGRGYINISALKLSKLCKYNFATNSNILFLLTHNSSRTSHYTQRELPLKINIEAPYGCELEKYPDRPNQFPTNYSRSVVKPLPVIGAIIGGGLLIAGIVIEFSNQENGKTIDNEQVTNGRIMMTIGLLFSVLSFQNMTKNIPDYDRNYQNEIRNKNLINEWQREYNRVDQLNRLIRATFKIRFSMR